MVNKVGAMDSIGKVVANVGAGYSSNVYQQATPNKRR